MRDLLPAEARFQSEVGRDVMACFERFAYERVWLPTFEFAEVLNRSQTVEGLALKFIEPETGEVVALRSDMTPQIARVVTTRFASAPRPLRLCYQGSVVRRRKERARTESQVVQAGAELIGCAGSAGDFEMIELLCAAVRAARLDEFVLDLGHSGIAASLMAQLVPAARRDLREALAAKDTPELERVGRRAGLAGNVLQALAHLPDLHGGESVWPLAERHLAGTPAEPHVEELRALVRRAREDELAPRILADLGETRDLDYYTGPVVQLLAHGPGEPVASGGRYDGLYQRFGASSAAAGFAIDLNHLCWALRHRGRSVGLRSTLVASEACDAAVLRALRARDIACATAPEPRACASYWRYGFVLEDDPLRLTHLASNESTLLQGDDAEALAHEAASFLQRVTR